MRNSNPSTPITPSDTGTLEIERMGDVFLRGALAAFVTDAAGIVVFFNQAAEKMLGYGADEIVGKQTPQIWLDSEEVLQHAAALSAECGAPVTAGAEALFKKARLSGIETKEWTAVRAGGSRFPLEMTISRTESGGEEMFAVILRDISGREQTIAKLTESNIELERFAHIAAHDMQEPLRAMSNFSDIVATEYQSLLDDNGRLYLKLIRESAARMQVMVVDMLEYARAGKDAAGKESFAAGTEYKSAVQNLASEIASSGAKITCDPLPSIVGNAGQFARLLQNLIGNGLKYRRAGIAPVLQVRAEDKKDHWLFLVADKGIGIEEKNLLKIFEPFKRLHARQEYPGTGLGLSVCKKIVENHGGKVWCTSVPGAGSVFFFTWPK